MIKVTRMGREEMVLLVVVFLIVIRTGMSCSDGSWECEIEKHVISTPYTVTRYSTTTPDPFLDARALYPNVFLTTEYTPVIPHEVQFSSESTNYSYSSLLVDSNYQYALFQPRPGR